MTGRVQQIEQEICNLNVAIAELESSIVDLRRDYLQSVAVTFVQEMILAVYQVCTGSFAEVFLSLSLDQKFQLQRDLQVLCHSFREQILALSKDSSENLADPEELDLTQMMATANAAVSDLLANFGFQAAEETSQGHLVNLRLLDLELANRLALSKRSQVRVLMARSQSLRAEVAKWERAKVTALAELAWRSTWMELQPD